MSLSEELNHILTGLNNAVPEIHSSLVASSDGMAIAARLNEGDANRMAAMSATAIGLGKRLCDSIGGGELAETSVSGKQGQVFIYACGAKGVLSVIATANANVGLINLECREAASKIMALLG